MIHSLDDDIVGVQIGSFSSHLTEVQSTTRLTVSLKGPGRDEFTILLSGSSDGMIVAWDVEFSQQLLSWKAHTGGIIMLSADPMDMNCFWSQGRDGCLHKWCFSRNDPSTSSSCPDSKDTLAELDTFLHGILGDSTNNSDSGSMQGSVLTTPKKEATILCGFGSFCKMHILTKSVPYYLPNEEIEKPHEAPPPPRPTAPILSKPKPKVTSKFSLLEIAEQEQEHEDTGMPPPSPPSPPALATHIYDVVLIAVPAIDSGVIEIWDTGFRSYRTRDTNVNTITIATHHHVERLAPRLLSSVSIPAYAAEFVVSGLIGTVETRTPGAKEVPSPPPVPDILQSDVLKQELEAWRVLNTTPGTTPGTTPLSDSSIQQALTATLHSTASSPSSSFDTHPLPHPLPLWSTPREYTDESRYVSILVPGESSGVKDLIQKGGTVLTAQMIPLPILSQWRRRHLIERYAPKEHSPTATTTTTTTATATGNATPEPSSSPISPNIAPYRGKEKLFLPSTPGTTFYETFRHKLVPASTNSHLHHTNALPRHTPDTGEHGKLQHVSSSLSHTRYRFIPRYGIIDDMALVIATETGGVFLCDIGTLYLMPPTAITQSTPSLPPPPLRKSNVVLAAAPVTRHPILPLAYTSAPDTTSSQTPNVSPSSHRASYALVGTAGPHLHCLKIQYHPVHPVHSSSSSPSSSSFVFSGGKDGWIISRVHRIPLPERGVSALACLSIYRTRNQGVHNHHPDRRPEHDAHGNGDGVLDAVLGCWSGMVYWLRLPIPLEGACAHRTSGTDGDDSVVSGVLPSNELLLRRVLSIPHASTVNSLTVLSSSNEDNATIVSAAADGRMRVFRITSP